MQCLFAVRLSAFNLYVSDFPEPGTTLVHNTFSGGFAELPAPTLAALRKADAGHALEPAEQALIDPDLSDPDVGIVVENRQVEEQAYRAYHERRRSSTAEMSVIVSVTYACNLDCTYCCQSDFLDGTTMKEPIVEATATWLAERALAIGTKLLDLVFVGGEPLLHPGRIERILARVRELVGDRVRVVFHLLTNGMFLTRELVEKWVPLGLEGAQVTVDGDEHTHPLTRRSKKRGENSYRQIFQNIIDTCDLIDINVNGNYQAETAGGFVPLIKELATAGFRRGSRVRFTPALTGLGAPSDAAYGSCTWSGSSPELIVTFSDEIRRAGFDPGDPLDIGPCGFHRRHYYAIDPDGSIYKCPGFLGHTQWAIGHVASGLTSRYDALANSNPQRECGSCAHRPECAGGCVASAWLEAGRAEGVGCEIGYFEKHQRDLVSRRYLLATSASTEEALARFPAPPVAIPPPRVAPAPSMNVVPPAGSSGRRSAALRVLAA